MTLTTGQALASIFVMAAVTFLTRVLPFVLFGRGDSAPKIVLYLGRVLPPAVIGMLVIYCLKNVSVLAVPFGLPEFIAVAAVIVLHVWKRNNLLSIGVGTAL